MKLDAYPLTFSPALQASYTNNSADKPRPCAFTIDVEDWYQSTVDFDAPISTRVVDNTERILAVLNQYNTKATFFVQGLVAESYPKLLHQIIAEGHEIQSHGYSHRPLHKMDRKELTTELEFARKTIEDACGVSVTAFRAPDFAITKNNLWSLEVLVEMGFKVDSSIFPLKTHRYGISRWPITPHHVHLPNGAEILEVPVAIWSFGPLRVPLAGGGYFRLIPGTILRNMLRSLIDQFPVIIYCHPYEYNDYELRDYHKQISRSMYLSQVIGRKAFISKVHNLLKEFPFGRLDHVLDAWGLK